MEIYASQPVFAMSLNPDPRGKFNMKKLIEILLLAINKIKNLRKKNKNRI